MFISICFPRCQGGKVHIRIVLVWRVPVFPEKLWCLDVPMPYGVCSYRSLTSRCPLRKHGLRQGEALAQVLPEWEWCNSVSMAIACFIDFVLCWQPACWLLQALSLFVAIVMSSFWRRRSSGNPGLPLEIPLQAARRQWFGLQRATWPKSCFVQNDCAQNGRFILPKRDVFKDNHVTKMSTCILKL